MLATWDLVGSAAPTQDTSSCKPDAAVALHLGRAWQSYASCDVRGARQ